MHTDSGTGDATPVTPTPPSALDTLMLLTGAGLASAAALDEKLARIGVTTEDLRVLTAAGSAGADRTKLAHRLHAPVSEAVRKARPLQKLGWLQRATDGRFVLTTSGERLVDEASSLAQGAAEHWLLERLDPDQLAKLRTLLRPLDSADESTDPTPAREESSSRAGRGRRDGAHHQDT